MPQTCSWGRGTAECSWSGTPPPSLVTMCSVSGECMKGVQLMQMYSLVWKGFMTYCTMGTVEIFTANPQKYWQWKMYVHISSTAPRLVDGGLWSYTWHLTQTRERESGPGVLFWLWRRGDLWQTIPSVSLPLPFAIVLSLVAGIIVAIKGWQKLTIEEVTCVLMVLEQGMSVSHMAQNIGVLRQAIDCLMRAASGFAEGEVPKRKVGFSGKSGNFFLKPAQL